MYHDDDYLDGFSAMFGDGRVVFPKRNLPLGAVTVDILNLDEEVLRRLQSASWTLRDEMLAFLSGDYYVTQAGLMNDALKEFFSLLREFPVYRELEWKRMPSMTMLRTNHETRERMQTEGTEEYTETQTWLSHLNDLVPTVKAFRQRTERLLEENFSDITDRTPSGYAKRLSEYYTHVGFEYLFASDALDDEDLHGEEFERQRTEYREVLEREYFPTHFPIAVTYRALSHPKNDGAYLLAEEIFFHDLGSFLALDLMRGFMAGHLPRRCDHCGRWFLLESGYDIRYCENPAPGEAGKTCRQVGAHRKEVRLNGTDEIRAEYMRVSNRLKG